MAANDQAALVVALSAQLTKFERDMKRAGDIADQQARNIENRFNRVNIKAGGLDSLLSSIGRFATVGGIVSTLNQLIQLNKQVNDIGDAATRVGLTTEEFQKFRFAVVATGGSVELAETFLDKFTQKMGEAAQGSGDLFNFLKANNIAISEFTKLPVNEQLSRYADLVKNSKTAQDQFNNTLIVAGRRAAPEMVEVLREGSEGLKKFGIEGQQAGVIINDVLIEKAQRANDEFEKLKQRVITFFQETAVKIIETQRQQGSDNEQIAKDWANNWRIAWAKLVELAKQHVPQVVSEMERIREESEKIKKDITFADRQGKPRQGSEILSADPFADRRFLLAPVPTGNGRTRQGDESFKQGESFQKLIDAQQKRIDLLNVEAEHLTESVGIQTQYRTQIELENNAKAQGIPLSADRLAKIAEEARKTGEAAQRLEDYRRQWQGLNEALQFAGDQMVTILEGIASKTLTAADAMRQLTSAIIRALLQAALLGQGPLGNILGFGAKTPGGTGGLLGSLLGAFTGGGAGAIRPGGIGHAAGGGSFGKGDWSVVGERGPELVRFGRNGQVIPNEVFGSRSRGSSGPSIIVNNYVANDAETRQSGGGNGEAVIIDIVKRHTARGAFDDVNRSRFGNRPNKVR